jgi:hypothetical protein
MAKKVNKSEEVRNHLAANPDEGPSAVSEALKKRGIKVSPNFVSNIKLKLKTHGTPKKRGRRPLAATNGESNGYGTVYAAAAFIRSCGGVHEAKEALAVAARVLDAGA